MGLPFAGKRDEELLRTSPADGKKKIKVLFGVPEQVFGRTQNSRLNTIFKGFFISTKYLQ
jgi:hypothetical protein